MMKEVFVPVKGYEGKYEISNLRRVKSLRRGVLRSDGIRRWVNERIIYSDKESMCLGQIPSKKGKMHGNSVNPLKMMVSSFYRDYSPKTHHIVTREGKESPNLYDLMVLKKLPYNKMMVIDANKEYHSYSNIEQFCKDHKMPVHALINMFSKGGTCNEKYNKFDGWTFTFESPIRINGEYNLIFTLFDLRYNNTKKYGKQSKHSKKST